MLKKKLEYFEKKYQSMRSRYLNLIENALKTISTLNEKSSLNFSISNNIELYNCSIVSDQIIVFVSNSHDKCSGWPPPTVNFLIMGRR